MNENKAVELLGRFTNDALQSRYAHLEGLASAYLAATNLSPEQVELVEEQKDGKLTWHFRPRSEQVVSARIATAPAIAYTITSGDVALQAIGRPESITLDPRLTDAGGYANKDDGDWHMRNTWGQEAAEALQKLRGPQSETSPDESVCIDCDYRYGRVELAAYSGDRMMMHYTIRDDLRNFMMDYIRWMADDLAVRVNAERREQGMLRTLPDIHSHGIAINVSHAGEASASLVISTLSAEGYRVRDLGRKGSGGGNGGLPPEALPALRTAAAAINRACQEAVSPPCTPNPDGTCGCPRDVVLAKGCQCGGK